jgi:hypothetical protein
MRTLQNSPAYRKVDDSLYVIKQGSAYVMINVVPWGDNRAMVRWTAGKLSVSRCLKVSRADGRRWDQRWDQDRPPLRVSARAENGFQIHHVAYGFPRPFVARVGPRFLSCFAVSSNAASIMRGFASCSAWWRSYSSSALAFATSAEILPAWSSSLRPDGGGRASAEHRAAVASRRQ